MLKFQITLIAILIGCVAFVSCERAQKVLEPAMPEADTMDTGDMMNTGMDMMDKAMYESWKSFPLPAPAMSLADAVAAHKPEATGQAHGKGSRTVYINDTGITGLMALKDGSMTTFPAGTMIVKVIMDDTNAFEWRVATMMKSADPMYAGHNGWMYIQTERPSTDAPYSPVAGDGTAGGSGGCHECHAKAAVDSVFVVQLAMDTMMKDGMMEDDMDAEDMDDGMMEDDMDDDMGDDGDGDGAAQ